MDYFCGIPEEYNASRKRYIVQTCQVIFSALKYSYNEISGILEFAVKPQVNPTESASWRYMPECSDGYAGP
jgi:hypothetical protein